MERVGQCRLERETTRMIDRRVRLCLIGFLLFAHTAAAAPSRSEVLAWLAQYHDATTLDEPVGRLAPDQHEVLVPYLPPGLIDDFRFPDLDLELTATAGYPAHASYQEATALHQDQARIAADGSLENYTAGQPFSPARIMAAAAGEAGHMVAWNHIHRWQHRGYMTGKLIMNYVVPTASGSGGTLRDGFSGGGHITRYIAQAYYRVYLSHVASLPDNGYRVDVPDSERILWKDYIDITEPFDLKGMRFVVERALDAQADDQVNSYLPTERRVRRLSAKERADAFLGSNYSLDDFEGFSGRVLDFDWTLVGHKAVLQVADSRESVLQFHGPVSRVPRDRWQVRRCWLVEHRPKWQGHPVATKLLFIDEETWNVVLALLFDRNDALAKSIMTAYRRDPNGGPDGPPGASVSRWSGSIATNFEVNDATVTRAIEPVDFPEFEPAEIRRIFSVSSLSEGR